MSDMLESEKTSEPMHLPTGGESHSYRPSSGVAIERGSQYPPDLRDRTEQRRTRRAIDILTVLVLLTILFWPVPFNPPSKPHSVTHTSAPPCGTSPASHYLPLSLAQGICVNSNNIGVSDGSTIFVNRTEVAQEKLKLDQQQIPQDQQQLQQDRQNITIEKQVDTFKQQAAAALKQGNLRQALQGFEQAIKLDPSDGEAQIYAENLRVLLSGCSYRVIVVATMLTPSIDGDFTGVGRDDLQGVFVQDYEFNHGSVDPNNLDTTETCGSTPRALLLIANSGSHNVDNQANEMDVSRIVSHIIYLAQDSRFVGVIGWPFTAGSYAAVKLLYPTHHIVMVSPTSTGDCLTNPYFFSIAPRNSQISDSVANLAKNTFLAQNIAVIITDNSSCSYSNTLTKDVENSFGRIGATEVDCLSLGTAASKASFDANDPRATLKTKNNDTAKTETEAANCWNEIKLSNKRYDLIFFTGYADAFDAFNGEALKLSKQMSVPPIMGGDTLYELYNYKTNYQRFYFVSFSYPDQTNPSSPFSRDYPTLFDPASFDLHHTKAGAYSYGRADNDTILSYDTLFALLKEYTVVLQQNGGKFTENQLNKIMQSMSGPIQGASGPIQFEQDGEPIGKKLLFFYVDGPHPVPQGQQPYLGHHTHLCTMIWNPVTMQC